MLEYEILDNEYRFNRRFRDDVDRYCTQTGITVREALSHEAVKLIYLKYTEV